MTHGRLNWRIPPSALAILALAIAGTWALAPDATLATEVNGKSGSAREIHRPVSLDDLFARLRDASDPAEAKGVATLIGRRMARSGSATVDLLTDRAREAATMNDAALAVELMDRAMTLEPHWSEGWNRRATLFWRLSDSQNAIADLEHALVLEPRHFEAWSALGKVYLANDDKGRALDAFRRAETIYPQWEELKKAIERLSPEVDGRDL